MNAKQPSDQYSEQETQQRFEKLVDAALRTPHKPLKSMTLKGVPAQSRKQRKRKHSS
jgi:spore germination protein GerM